MEIIRATVYPHHCVQEDVEVIERPDAMPSGLPSRQKRIRVAAYCRVSTLMEMQDSSYETQRDYYIRLIDRNPAYELVEIYGDHGASGRSMAKRPQFRRMLQDCENGKIDMILTKSISRFARNLPDCIRVIRRLQALRIPILFEKENIDTLDVKSELLLNVLAMVAEEESVSISQNMRWTHERRNAAGDPFSKAPYGYRRDAGSNQWHVHEKEARRVRYAYARANEGCCYVDILAGLNQMEKEAGIQRLWSHQRMIHMLTHEAYIGDILTNKSFKLDANTQVRNNGERDQYYIEDHHEPIISREVHERVKELVGRGLLRSGRVNFTAEEKAFLLNVIDQDVEGWRCMDWQEENYGEAMNGGLA